MSELERISMIVERKKNAVRGTFWGIIYRIVQIIFPFFIRTIFIHTLGVGYLGLNSLFSSILQVLNLAELGISSALVFSMYQPIVENNTEKLCQLMNLYKKYYRIIGLIVLIIGLILLPFLPYLIRGRVTLAVNIYVLYVMHLASTVASYWLFAYRNSLFQAHQRVDIVTIIQIVVNICMYIMQAIILLIFQNYYLYLSLTVIAQIMINIITAIVSKQFYPDYVPKGDLSRIERKTINQKVRDLFTAKIGSVINNAADSIVISSFLGLEMLAIYQNYYYIISALMSLFSIFFASCTAGIGNSLIVKSKEMNRQLLYNINHITFLAINYCCTCFVSMCQPFMKMWVGEKYELPFSFVILFAIYLFAEEAPRTLIAFKDAGGIWRHDRFRPLLSALFNLSLNLILTPIIGLYGIIISTIAAFLLVSLPWIIVNINKRLFEINILSYLKRLISYIVVIVISSGVSFLINDRIRVGNNWIELLLRFIVATVISITIYFASFYRLKETKYILDNLTMVIIDKGKIG